MQPSSGLDHSSQAFCVTHQQVGGGGSKRVRTPGHGRASEASCVHASQSRAGQVGTADVTPPTRTFTHALRSLVVVAPSMNSSRRPGTSLHEPQRVWRPSRQCLGRTMKWRLV